SMGIPTWVMVPFSPNWYFGAKENRTDWYPSMHLYRQRNYQHWFPVTMAIINALSSRVATTPYKLIHPEQLCIQQAKKLFDEKKIQECIRYCNVMLKQYPRQTAFYFFLGIAAMALNDAELAVSSLLVAEKVDTKNADIYTNLGTIFYRIDETDKAVFYFRKALELTPNNPECLRNLAISCFELGFPEESLDLYRKAIKLKDSVENHFGYSLQLLGAGQYEEGWREYEYRLKMPQHNYTHLKLKSPMWDGSSLNDKTIFICSEQGLGDNIQFLRFIPLLKQHYTCQIILGCSSNLLRIVKQYEDIDIIICENDLIPNHDYHLPIISLAMLFKIYNESQFMSHQPYIIPHLILADYWKQVFATNKKLKVGFCWAGSPQHVNNLRRNCDLFDFIKLSTLPNIKFYSLQRDYTEKERDLLSTSDIENLGDMFDDLADAAAAISQLDLVLSIDSGLAHLAGAMGKKTWLIVPYYTEWRHQRNREYSPWYSSVKLYWQPAPGDWKSVFKQLEKDLILLSTELSS
ncbi:MAG: tetratricopeptide repeat protein, partial [Gammaproteobacteria bacterium]